MFRFLASGYLFLLLLFGSCNSSSQQFKKTVPVEIDYFRHFVHDSLKHLLPILDSVYYRDKLYRDNKDKEIFRNHSEEIRLFDSINLEVVKPIIDRYGILGMDEIGAIGYTAIVMTIQHANLETQRKYLPQFEKAIKRRKIVPANYAMLVDRIAVKSGEMQVYGTQINIAGKNAELLPVKDIDSIDLRRASIGIKEKIETYVKRFDIKWNLEKYKKDLPSLIEKYKLK